MRALRYGYGLSAALMFSLSAACAYAQGGGITGPDFLQSLGVGSRSIAMGSAFSAIADDASATFWNPGRLSVVRTNQFMLDYHTVLGSRSFSNGILGTSQVATRPGGLQATFLGVVWPLVTRQRKYIPGEDRTITVEKYYGHIGLSFALGGYFDRKNQVLDFNPVDPEPDPAKKLRDETLGEQTVRNQFVTLAYGNRVDFGKKGRLGWGAGILFLIHDQRFVDFSRTFDPATGRTDTINTAADRSFNGNGTGYILGLAYGIGPDYRQWRLGLTYRPKIKIGFGDTTGAAQGQGPGFGNEIPSRLSVGLAYESDWGSRGDQVRATVEGQFFSSANRDLIPFVDNTGNTLQLAQQDARVSASNLHIGFEYVPTNSPLRFLFGRGNIVYPLRIGFRTNENAARLYTHYTNVVSLGFGIQGRDRNNNTTFSFEPAVEILTRDGTVLWNLTAMARF